MDIEKEYLIKIVTEAIQQTSTNMLEDINGFRKNIEQLLIDVKNTMNNLNKIGRKEEAKVLLSVYVFLNKALKEISNL